MKGFYGFWHRILAEPVRFVFNIRVVGKENEPKDDDGRYLVCANHMSAGDPVWLCAAFSHHQLHFMAKAELFKIPLLRGLIRLLGAYPVARGSADISSLRTTVSLLKNGEWVGIFPQGTRRKGLNPADTPVKSGVGMIAVRAETNIIPVFIETKKFVSSPFCKKVIHIGEPIKYETIRDMHSEHNGYSEISNYIFGEVCALGGLKKTCGASQNDE